ncbi:flagellar assembly peptidoglycan hydrolase FlgJ [Thermithiobacillus plumbiphilus]|uniref:Peptidoglycan hydrolase FlgJ n=1 Tax=Thermithiobacillus plumbiphilus TaxID=1729899 RepID=A0ABU9DAN1_9PROT
MKGLGASDTQSVLDFTQLRSLQTQAQQQDPQALKKAAQQFEALFTQQMLKGMRATLPGNPLTSSNEGKMYQGMLDQQLAQNLSQGRGFGLAEMLVRQLGIAKPPVQGTAAGFEAMARRIAPHTPAPAESSSPAPRGALERAKQFIADILPAAREAAKALGVSPVAVLAHAALETGWGKSVPRDGKNQPSFNLFGIKASGWAGRQVEAGTHEFRQGLQQMERAAFRAYDSVADGVQDYARLLQGSKRYQQVLGMGDDIAGFARGLQKAGYATDPRYAEKLTATAKGHRMQSILNSLGIKP